MSPTSGRTAAGEGPTPDPVLACAADDGFALPLTVTIASALSQLPSARRLTLYLLDGGISAENRRRIEASWDMERMTLHWLAPRAVDLQGLPVSGHVNLLTYFRLLLPTALPDTVRRVLYLDSDLLVRRDLSELWDQPLEDLACLAVPEVACPYLDAAKSLANYRRCAQYLAALRPVPNYAALGMASTAKYFNGGVLLIDLERWRREQATSQLLQCLHDHRRHVKYWDQYALNVVMAGRWGELDVRWNQGAHVYRYPSWRESPFEQAEYERLLADPYIVHFSSPSKPWQDGNRHPFREEYFRVVDQTAWVGWRPTAERRTLRQQATRALQEAILFGGRKYRFLRANLGL